jgi:hypothetical protein
VTSINHCDDRRPDDHDLCASCESPFEPNDEGSACVCASGDHLSGDSETCYPDIAHCVNYDNAEQLCEDCAATYDLYGDGAECVDHIEHCITRDPVDHDLCVECSDTFSVSQG